VAEVGFKDGFEEEIAVSRGAGIYSVKDCWDH
jgi:hypothetical protein